MAGEPCVVKISGWTKAFLKNKDRKITFKTLPNNEFALDLKAGEEVILLPEPSTKISPVEPINLPANNFNFYGVKKGKELKWDQNWQLPEYTL